MSAPIKYSDGYMRLISRVDNIGTIVTKIIPVDRYY